MFNDIRVKEVKFYDFHSPAARDLLSKLLIKDPTERLQDPALIMSHTFFSSIKWDELIKRTV